MGAITDAAIGLGGDIAGGIFGLALEGHNDKRQIRQQQKLTDMQLLANKSMAQFNQNQAYEMWQKTNYPAQVEQLKNAGLNPALLYGMSGGGGATTSGGSGSGVSGAQAPGGGQEIMSMMMNKMQLEMMKAQTENIKADTGLKGAQIPQTEASTSLLTQQTANAQAQEIGQKIDNRIKEMQATLQGMTLQDQIDTIKYNMQRIYTDLQIAQNNKWISDETMYSESSRIQQESIGVYIKNLLTSSEIDKTQAGTAELKSKIDVNQQQIKNMAADIQQKWAQIDINDINSATQQFQATMSANYPSIWNVIGREANDTITELYKLMKDQRILRHQPKR